MQIIIYGIIIFRNKVADSTFFVSLRKGARNADKSFQTKLRKSQVGTNY